MKVTTPETEQMERYKKIEDFCDSLFDGMKRERAYIEPMWKKLTDLLLPEFSGWDYQIDQDIIAGERIFDGVSIEALSRLVDGIMGWMVSSTIDWLELYPKDPKDLDDKVFMEYLKTLETYLYDVFNRSNFYDAMSQDIKICAGLGTSVMVISDGEELECPIYEPLHPREFYISENKRKNCDVLVRRYKMTHRQLVGEFGEQYDDKTKRELMEKSEDLEMIRHTIYPNSKFVDDGSIKLAENKKYVSVYKLETGPMPQGNKTRILRCGGMDEQMFRAWRFMRASGQIYGTCYGMAAIYDIAMINLQSKTMIDSDQLAAKPPMQTSELMRGKLRIAPGGVTYGMDEVKPIITSYAPERGLAAMQRREQIIRNHFRTDFFQMINQIQGGSRERTKAEIDAMKAESAAALGAVIGRIESERLDPMVRMTLYIEDKAGRLPQMPDGIDKEKIFSLRFVGPLAQSQRKYIRVSGITEGLGSAMQLAQVAPDGMMNFDFNWAMRELAVAGGFPAAGLVSKDEVKKMQAAAQKQRAAQAQAAAENERLLALGRAGKTPEPGSAGEVVMKGGQ